MTLSLAQRRLANLAGFLACVAMMGYALYAERVLGFEPCPLCMFQRVGVVILGAVFLAAAVHAPAGVHVLRFGPERAAHPPVRIGPEVEGPDHLIEGAVQVIGPPAGEVAFGDGDLGDHGRFPFMLRCGI